MHKTGKQACLWGEVDIFVRCWFRNSAWLLGTLCAINRKTIL